MTLPSGIPLDELDPRIRPQDDLFRHVNGRWLARTETGRPRRVAHDELYAAFDVGATDELWLEPAARVRIW
jgi:predicted metalloendopeptidase